MELLFCVIFMCSSKNRKWAKLTDLYRELIAASILVIVLAVFTIGKSPVFRVDRAGAAIIGAALMMAFGVLSFEQAAVAVDYRTIVVLFALMVVVANLKVAGFFDLLGQLILRHIKTKCSLLAVTLLVSGLLSAIAINDIVCLLFTPVVIFVCRQGSVNPLPYLLGLAMASNIGSVATFLGNPQNILIGNLSHMSFMVYFLQSAPIAIVGLVILYIMLRWVYKHDLVGDLAVYNKQDIYFHRYLAIKTLLVLGFIVMLYVLGYDIAVVASLGAAFLLVTRRIKPNKIYISIDFNLLVMFIGLFVVVGGIEVSGLLDRLTIYIPVETMQSLEVFSMVSIVLSNIVSNVPAVLLIQYYIPDNSLLHWQALAIFSTLAGNLTVFGSIANLIVVEIAKKNNINITAKAYFNVGCPLTIILTLLAVIWLA